ncbi:hypothetical protein MYCTH_2107239 [Thermothelomyces thermophilus ATCC 42464]|uniref:Uncharacterized protein n=1 Tax=Thermothelomyces thermophilus (strain ATCC 42464 / BCRC 31852 / DSM 1799) TaxID=573729 RepID=G2Q4M4_THET4|nr:uncharacterized protein MYCTH_2107239 [Thermothelomyces thermophilus ATCC 42464]AEO54513.1 hypothetical protein MYCTH_2107239 [Thermothelomyces thermophilus ATCC 42464]
MPKLSTDAVDTCFSQMFREAAKVLGENPSNSFASDPIEFVKWVQRQPALDVRPDRRWRAGYVASVFSDSEDGARVENEDEDEDEDEDGASTVSPSTRRPCYRPLKTCASKMRPAAHCARRKNRIRFLDDSEEEEVVVVVMLRWLRGIQSVPDSRIATRFS